MLPPSLVPDLSRVAEPVIATILAHGGARTSKPHGEVSAVRTMTLDGFDDIAAAWSPIVRTHGFCIDLRAVFCHSRPQVSFTPVPHPNFTGGKNPRQCELADLLIVIDHVDRVRSINDRKAVLVQAKILKGDAVRPMAEEWVQHELLAWLPAFTFVDKGYDPRTRQLGVAPPVGLTDKTAEYAGLNLNSSPPEWRHELTQTTSPWFHSRISLASYLASMATGGHSCGREAVIGGSDDWSFTVDELLRVTAAHPITLKCGVARGNNNVVGFIADTSALACGAGIVANGAYDARTGDRGGGGDSVEGFDDNLDWPEGPISTVHMTLNSLDDKTEE